MDKQHYCWLPFFWDVRYTNGPINFSIDKSGIIICEPPLLAHFVIDDTAYHNVLHLKGFVCFQRCAIFLVCRKG